MFTTLLTDMYSTTPSIADRFNLSVTASQNSASNPEPLQPLSNRFATPREQADQCVAETRGKGAVKALKAHQLQCERWTRQYVLNATYDTPESDAKPRSEGEIVEMSAGRAHVLQQLRGLIEVSAASTDPVAWLSTLRVALSGGWRDLDASHNKMRSSSEDRDVLSRLGQEIDQLRHVMVLSQGSQDRPVPGAT